MPSGPKPHPVEVLEYGLTQCVVVLKFLLEALSALCVALGLASTLKLAFTGWRSDNGFVAIRLRFGSWLALALEFQLGADVVATTVAPTFDALAKLAVLAVVRTLLNYFLQRELRSEKPDS